MSSDFLQLFSLPSDDGDADDEAAAEPEAPRWTWFGPPEDELGAVVPLQLVIGRSENGVVAIPYAIVYSSGATFDVVALARGLTDAQSHRLFHEQHLFEEDEEPAPGLLRLGLELPGGERFSNLGGRRQRRRFLKPDTEPEGPVFIEHGGGGGSAAAGRVRLHPSFWLWPLPGQGAIRIFCEWPVVEIPLSDAELSGNDLAAAAQGVQQLWPPSA
jgi:hypothetical protein